MQICLACCSAGDRLLSLKPVPMPIWLLWPRCLLLDVGCWSLETMYHNLELLGNFLGQMFSLHLGNPPAVATPTSRCILTLYAGMLAQYEAR